MSTREAYLAAVGRAADCIHGVQGGDVVRPWLGTPGCPFCRRRDPVCWRFTIVTADVDRSLL